MSTGANSHEVFERDEGIDVLTATMLYKRCVAKKNNCELDGRIFEQIGKGKCQRQHYKEILKFWRSLQTLIHSKSQGELADLIFAILKENGRKLFARTKGESAMDNPEIMANILELLKRLGISTDNVNEGFNEANKNLNQDTVVIDEMTSVESSANDHNTDHGIIKRNNIKENLPCGMETSMASRKIDKECKQEAEETKTITAENIQKLSKQDFASETTAQNAAGSMPTSSKQGIVSHTTDQNTEPKERLAKDRKDLGGTSTKSSQGLEESNDMNEFYDRTISKQHKNGKGSTKTSVFKSRKLGECKEETAREGTEKLGTTVAQPTKRLEHDNDMNAYVGEQPNDGQGSKNTNSKDCKKKTVNKGREILGDTAVQRAQHLEQDTPNNGQGSKNTAPDTNSEDCKKTVNEGEEEFGVTAVQRARVNLINNSLEEKCKGLMETVKNKDDIISANEKKIQDMENRDRKLKEQRQKLKEKMKNLIEENRKLRVKVEKNDEYLKRYFRQVTNLISSVQDYQDENGELNRAINQLHREAEISEARISLLSERERDQSERNANAEGRMIELNRENRNLNEQIRMYRENFTRERRRKERFRRMNQVYRENLERERREKERLQRLIRGDMERRLRHQAVTNVLRIMAQHAVGALEVVGFTQDVEVKRLIRKRSSLWLDM